VRGWWGKTQGVVHKDGAYPQVIHIFFPKKRGVVNMKKTQRFLRKDKL
jgi:hypothetical protein